MGSTNSTATTCPTCGRTGTLTPIVYGEPRDEDWARARHGEIILGGPLPAGNAPTHRCSACNTELTIRLSLWQRTRRAISRVTTGLAPAMQTPPPPNFWLYTFAAVPLGWIVSGVVLGLAVSARAEDVRWANIIASYGIGAVLGLAVYLALGWLRLLFRGLFPVPEEAGSGVQVVWLVFRLALLAAACHLPFILLVGALLG